MATTSYFDQMLVDDVHRKPNRRLRLDLGTFSGPSGADQMYIEADGVRVTVNRETAKRFWLAMDEIATDLHLDKPG